MKKQFFALKKFSRKLISNFFSHGWEFTIKKSNSNTRKYKFDAKFLNHSDFDNDSNSDTYSNSGILLALAKMSIFTYQKEKLLEFLKHWVNKLIIFEIILILESVYR